MRNGQRLEMSRVRQRPEVGNERVLVAGREQRTDQNEVRHPRVDGGNRGVRRPDDHDVRVGTRAQEVPKRVGLNRVRFDRKDKRHSAPHH